MGAEGIDSPCLFPSSVTLVDFVPELLCSLIPDPGLERWLLSQTGDLIVELLVQLITCS